MRYCYEIYHLNKVIMILMMGKDEKDSRGYYFFINCFTVKCQIPF